MRHSSPDTEISCPITGILLFWNVNNGFISSGALITLVKGNSTEKNILPKQNR